MRRERIQTASTHGLFKKKKERSKEGRCTFPWTSPYHIGETWRFNYRNRASKCICSELFREGPGPLLCRLVIPRERAKQAARTGLI